ncbi:NAD(P)-binding protein [bacterium]|nr:NAD(P)-binding protein [bacterium]
MKKRIAVLGGGLGSMTTMFTLMEDPDWREKYEFTVYQLGWRLGGKGASGRNSNFGERIEEHGLHIWLGFYENAFRMIKRAYAELDRPEGSPLRNWQDAFKPGNLIVFTEHIDGAWKYWPIEFPTNDEEPGTGGVLPTVWDYIHMLIEMMHGQVHDSSALDELLQRKHGHGLHGIIEKFVHDLEHVGATAAEFAGLALLEEARRLSKRLDPDPATHDTSQHHVLLGLVDGFMKWLRELLEHELDEHDGLRRLFIMLDLAYAIVRGIITDGVLERGFSAINDVEFRAWLARNGASMEYSVHSAPIQSIYDLVFAYERGNTTDPACANLEAGTGCYGMLRMLLTYKGSLYWKMQAGMGDTIFTPFYELLCRYPDNIRIAFFHQVTSIDSDDGERVTSINVFEQVRLREGIDKYEPLVEVKGLPCWPSAPLYDQLDPKDAEELQKEKINLESFWSPWRDKAAERTRTLRVDEDFDEVICGIPPAMLTHLLADSIKEKPAWSAMLAAVKSVQTQGMQLWLAPDLKGLGWTTTDTPLLGAYVEKESTWADMSDLIQRENWPADATPKSLAYFCGVFEEVDSIPPWTDSDFPAQEYARLGSDVTAWQLSNIATLWPDVVDSNGGFKPGVLLSQYLRANIDPNERYVLSVVGSTAHRLEAGGSGLSNMVLAGDWVRNIINAGCVEAAVIGGMRAARALSGRPVHIIGEEHGPEGTA